MFRHSLLTRLLALCMALSAVVPIIVFFQQVLPQLRAGDSSMLIILVPMCLLFVFCIFAGVRFLLGHVSAYRWVFVLFLLQVPIVEAGNFGYRWYTGLEIALLYVGMEGKLAQLTYNVSMGATASFSFGDPVDSTAIGINLFSLIAAIILYRARNRAHPVNGQGAQASA